MDWHVSEHVHHADNVTSDHRPVFVRLRIPSTLPKLRAVHFTPKVDLTSTSNTLSSISPVTEVKNEVVLDMSDLIKKSQ